MTNVSREIPLNEGNEAVSFKRRTIRGSFLTAASQLARFAIQFGSQIILARLLFPAEFGLLAMAYPVIAFLQVFNDIGLGQAIVQRPVIVDDQMSALLWVNLGLSCALSCLVALLGPLAAWIFHEPRLTMLIAVMGLAMPIAALSISPSALLTRYMRFGTLSRNEVSSMFIGSLVTVASAWWGCSYWSLVFGQFANAISGSILAWLSVRWRPTRPVFSANVWRDVAFGANITLSNLAAFVTTSGDNVIVGLTAGKIPLGLYDRSYNLVVRPINQLLSPLNRVAIPLLSRLTDKTDEYRRAYLDMVRLSVLMVVPGMLVCIVISETVMAVVLGHRWISAAPIFKWICVGGLTSAVYGSAYWLFLSQDRSGELRTFSIAAAALNIVCYLIGSMWGVVGIAASASIGFSVLTAPLMMFAATRKGPVRQSDLATCIIPYLIGGFFDFVILRVCLRLLAVSGLQLMVIATGISYAVFISSALMADGNRKLLKSGIRLVKSSISRLR